MRSRNLKISLIIFGALHIAQGVVLIVAPDRAAEFTGFEEIAAFFLAIIGATFIAAGVSFAISGLDPLGNINGVRFAVLWASLLLVIQLYSLGQGYVDFSQIWPGVVESAVFTVAFLVFYPYRRQA